MEVVGKVPGLRIFLQEICGGNDKKRGWRNRKNSIKQKPMNCWIHRLSLSVFCPSFSRFALKMTGFCGGCFAARSLPKGWRNIFFLQLRML